MTEKILIIVKTYPTISRKYAELVCTAGVTENGDWRRLYPIRFRQLYEQQKYKKYQWVEAKLEKSAADNRPESYKKCGSSDMNLQSKVNMSSLTPSLWCVNLPTKGCATSPWMMN